jgi:hypothetical protein
MSADDKAGLVTLRRWSSEPALLATDNLILLVTERMSDISRRLLASPQLVAITVPYPDEALRRTYLTEHVAGITTEMPLDGLAKVTAGLSLTQVRSLLQMAKQSEQPVTFAMVTGRISLRAPEYSPISSADRVVRRMSSSRHCRAETVFVTRIRVVAWARDIASAPTMVLPAPQGNTMIPLRARPESH